MGGCDQISIVELYTMYFCIPVVFSCRKKHFLRFILEQILFAYFLFPSCTISHKLAYICIQKHKF